MKVTLGLPNHVLAAQFGWSGSTVEKMVATYSHAGVGALEAIDAVYANNVVPLRPKTDAQTDAVAADPAS